MIRPDDRVTTKKVCYSENRLIIADVQLTMTKKMKYRVIRLNSTADLVGRPSAAMTSVASATPRKSLNLRLRMIGSNKLITANKTGGKTPVTTPLSTVFPALSPFKKLSQLSQGYVSINVFTLDKAPMNATGHQYLGNQMP